MQRPDIIVLTGLGVGYLPFAPGTWASLEAVLIVLIIHWTFPAQEIPLLLTLLVLAVVFGIKLSTPIVRSGRDPDPTQIVIDEIAGQILCLLWVPISGISLIVGFFLFRFFDIVKPYPVRHSERLKGGWGIVCDDLIAGLYAGFVLRLLL